jgi:hypothetical protein
MAANGTNFFPVTPGQSTANKLLAAMALLGQTMDAFLALSGKMGQIAADDATYVEMEQACGLTGNGQTGTGNSVGYRVSFQIAAVNSALQAAAVVQCRNQIG